jgi:NhaA family Na+:H+ antiporter
MLKKPKKILETFFKSDASVGLLLIFSSILALLISNSQNYQIYKSFFSQSLDLNIAILNYYKPLTFLDWINDFLMAIFFFLIGLELKSEIIAGELSTRKKMLLPTLCAISGVIFPILIFMFFNKNYPQNHMGFAIPCATDIAFAYGFIAIFKNSFSNSLKIFLVALAVIDDLIAIIIIAVFYTKNIDLFYLGYGFLAIIGLMILNNKNSKNLFLYGVFGLLLWLMILKSGIHATLAGIIFALFIPYRIKNYNFLQKIAHKISPTVNFAILPLFAFANSGIRLVDISWENTIFSELVLGIAFGLFFGKQLGIGLSVYFLQKFKLCQFFKDVSWLEFYGVAVLAGIGFTMSLFIGNLAFLCPNIIDKVRPYKSASSCN